MGKKLSGGLGGGIVKKVRKILDPLQLTQTFVDPIADQFLGTDLTGAKADARELTEQNTQREIAAQTFAQNQSIDLSTDNVAQVDLGGTTDAAGTGNRRKRRQTTASASSSLGINV